MLTHNPCCPCSALACCTGVCASRPRNTPLLTADTGMCTGRWWGDAAAGEGVADHRQYGAWSSVRAMKPAAALAAVSPVVLLCSAPSVCKGTGADGWQTVSAERRICVYACALQAIMVLAVDPGHARGVVRLQPSSATRISPPCAMPPLSERQGRHF